MSGLRTGASFGIWVAILTVAAFLITRPTAEKVSVQPPIDLSRKASPTPSKTYAGTNGLSGALSPDVARRAKNATVFIQSRQVSYLNEKEFVQGGGTGFFISPDGRVVTNWHVVYSSKERGGLAVPLKLESLKVIIRSGARDQVVLPARILAADPEADLAILKVEATGCSHLELVEGGEPVETTPLWILGFPFGDAFSVLHRGPELSVNYGHVSSLRHDDLGRLERIQFDAAVSRGNSGGPLITHDGRVFGVANLAIGTSRVNFAVPVARLKKLMKECPLDVKVGKACTFEVTSEPEGADVHLDWKKIGNTPLKVDVEGGWRKLHVSSPGKRSWSKAISIYDGRRVHADLPALAKVPLRTGLRISPPPNGASVLRHGKELFAEDFADSRASDNWQQNTGGSDSHAWYVEKGTLRQFYDDGVLHAVFAGEEKWQDYSFSARVRIDTNEKDGRAGLIFRADRDGFALFRLHRATSKVQLAYHTNHPFGWRILAERPLSQPVEGDVWHRMEVQVSNGSTVCLLNGNVVLASTAPVAPRGRVGFYSVDSRAAFDDARVCALPRKEKEVADGDRLMSFWFTDRFEKIDFWQSMKGDAASPPWPIVSGACLQLDASSSSRMNLLQRFDLYDCTAKCVVSSRAGTVGLVFRHEGKKRYLFTVDLEKYRAALWLEDRGERKELAASSDPRAVAAALGGSRVPMSAGALEGQRRGAGSAAGAAPVFTLDLLIEGRRLRAGVNNSVLLDTNDDTLSKGRLGFYTERSAAIFLLLNVTSPQ